MDFIHVALGSFFYDLDVSFHSKMRGVNVMNTEKKMIDAKAKEQRDRCVHKRSSCRLEKPTHECDGATGEEHDRERGTALGIIRSEDQQKVRKNSAHCHKERKKTDLFFTSSVTRKDQKNGIYDQQNTERREHLPRFRETDPKIGKSREPDLIFHFCGGKHHAEKAHDRCDDGTDLFRARLLLVKKKRKKHQRASENDDGDGTIFHKITDDPSEWHEEDS